MLTEAITFPTDLPLDCLEGLVGDRLADVGCNRYAFVALRPPAGRRQDYLSNYPREFSAHYLREDLKSIDPTFRLAFESMNPLLWQDIEAGVDERERRVFHDSSEFGIRRGVTVPIHGPYRVLSTLSVSSDLSEREFQAQLPTMVPQLEQIAKAVHLHILQRQDFGPADPPPQLSVREKDVLAWTSAGKSSWEISQILGVAEKTVEQHLANARQRLGVYKTVHAVIKAYMLGLIEPDRIEPNEDSSLLWTRIKPRA
ncbi:MAG: autoinducer binding domain-containing protein [Alphaproteobacteria bacterium]